MPDTITVAQLLVHLATLPPDTPIYFDGVSDGTFTAQLSNFNPEGATHTTGNYMYPAKYGGEVNGQAIFLPLGCN